MNHRRRNPFYRDRTLTTRLVAIAALMATFDACNGTIPTPDFKRSPSVEKVSALIGPAGGALSLNTGPVDVRCQHHFNEQTGGNVERVKIGDVPIQQYAGKMYRIRDHWPPSFDSSGGVGKSITNDLALIVLDRSVVDHNPALAGASEDALPPQSKSNGACRGAMMVGFGAENNDPNRRDVVPVCVENHDPIAHTITIHGDGFNLCNVPGGAALYNGNVNTILGTLSATSSPPGMCTKNAKGVFRSLVGSVGTLEAKVPTMRAATYPPCVMHQ